MWLTRNNIKDKIKNTFVETLQIEFIESDDMTTLEATMLVKKELTQSLGVLHGGATITLAESIAGVGSNAICASDERCLGMQISANHIATAEVGDVIHAKGTVIHQGKSTHVWNIDVFSRDTGKLISTVRATNAVLR